VEGCVPNEPRTLRTTGYVFWTVQQSSDVPDHDGLITEGVVVVYLDDILIFTETLEEHRRITRRVMDCSRKTTSSLNPRSASLRRRKWSTLE